MNQLLRYFVIPIGACAVATVAGAQANSDVVATLQVNKGVVMTSTGSEYASAVSGQSLVKSERVMIAQDSSATVTYSNGCKRVLDAPEVYTVDGVCTAAGWSVPGTVVGVAAGVVAVSVLVDNLNNNDQQQNPISR